LEILTVNSVMTVSVHVASVYSSHTITTYCECSIPVDDFLADSILNLQFLLKSVFTDPPASIASPPGET
jgi:hypothetical protein